MKPIFEALRKLKEAYNSDEKVRTLKTLIVPNEKAPEGANSLNGAGNCSVLEPISHLLKAVKDEEYQYIEASLFDIAA